MGHDSANPKVDFRALFESVPGLFIVLDVDPQFTILAASDAYLAATMTRREAIVGRPGFEVFPDNPEKPSDGEKQMRASFDRLLRTKQPDAMGVIKYDIRRPERDGGGFEERYWRVMNSPLLDDRGEVVAIIHRAEDVTESIRMRGDSARNLLAADVLRESETRLSAGTHVAAVGAPVAAVLADHRVRAALGALAARDQLRRRSQSSDRRCDRTDGAVESSVRRISARYKHLPIPRFSNIGTSGRNSCSSTSPSRSY